MNNKSQKKDEKRLKDRALRFNVSVVLLFYAAGIMLGERIDIPFGMVLVWVAAVYLGGIIFFLLRRTGLETLLMLVVVGLGILGFRIQVERSLRPLPEPVAQAVDQGREATLEGIVLRGGSPQLGEYDDNEKYLSLIIEAEKITGAGGNEEKLQPPVQVIGAWSPADKPLEAGDRIRITGRIRGSEPPRNFGQMNIMSQTGGMLYAGVISARGAGALTVLSHGSMPGFRGWVRGLRSKIHRLFSGAITPTRPAMIAESLIFGTELTRFEPLTRDQTLERAEIRRTFVRAGIIHILVVSGVHLSALISLFFLFNLRTHRRRWWLILGIGVLMVCYVIVIGGTFPALRALLMGFCVIIYAASGRLRDWINSLALAALVILILSPMALYSWSFQLSFTAMAGIAFIYPALNKVLLPTKSGFFRLLELTVAVQLALMPLAAYMTGWVNPVCLVTNLAVLPLAGVLVPMGLAGTVLGLIWRPLGVPFLLGLGWGCRVLDLLAQGSAAVPFSRAAVGLNHWVALAGWYLFLFGGFRLLVLIKTNPGDRAFSRHRAPVWITIFAGLNLLIWPGALIRRDTRLRLTVLDVQEGDAIALRTPEGRGVLIDAGPQRVAGRSSAEIIRRHFQRLGVPKLDAVILTHMDQDHIGGVFELMGEMGVENIMVAETGTGNSPERDIAAEARSLGIGLGFFTRGAGIRFPSGVTLEALWPPGEMVTDSDPEHNNELSIIIRVRYREFCALLTGDAGFKAELDLLNRPGFTSCDVLKVGHHGSGMSTHPMFLQTLRPQVAVISAGKYNTFGHPNGAVLERLRGAGARIYRTDRDGAVEIVSDGTEFQAHTAVEGY